MNDNLPARKSIRLGGYDYSGEGMYFVTICTQDRACLFGEVFDKTVKINEIGKIAKNELIKLPKRFLNIEMDEFIIMPNHIHGIITVGRGHPAQIRTIIIGLLSGERTSPLHKT